MPDVSVIVPVKNGASYVKRCVTCLKAQTLKHVEFLIIDDASTDGTPEQLLREIAGDDRFKVIRQAAQAGPLSARMRGVSEASAPVVMFMDFDDTLVPDACRTVAETMERENINVFCYAMEVVGTERCDVHALEKCRSYLSRRSSQQGRVQGAEDCFTLFFSNTGITASTCDKAVRTDVLRSVYSKIGDGAGLLCAQDYLQTTLLFLNVTSVYIDQTQVLYHYFLGSGMTGQTSGNVTWEQFMRRMTAIDTYRRLCLVLSAEGGIESTRRERVKAKFLRSIRNTALPEVWKLPPDLVNDGLEVISREWGDDAREFAERARPKRRPGILATLTRKIAGFIRRRAGKGKSE